MHNENGIQVASAFSRANIGKSTSSSTTLLLKSHSVPSRLQFGEREFGGFRTPGIQKTRSPRIVVSEIPGVSLSGARLEHLKSVSKFYSEYRIKFERMYGTLQTAGRGSRERDSADAIQVGGEKIANLSGPEKRVVFARLESTLRTTRKC